MCHETAIKEPGKAMYIMPKAIQPFCVCMRALYMCLWVFYSFHAFVFYQQPASVGTMYVRTYVLAFIYMWHAYRMYVDLFSIHIRRRRKKNQFCKILKQNQMQSNGCSRTTAHHPQIFRVCVCVHSVCIICMEHMATRHRKSFA